MKTLYLHRDSGIVTLTLDRPAVRNAIDLSMWDELHAAFDEVAANPDDRVLVVTGAGSGFCAGADRSTLADLQSGGLSRMRSACSGPRSLPSALVR